MKKYKEGDIVYCKKTRQLDVNDAHVYKNNFYKVDFVNSRLISIFGENDKVLYYRYKLDEFDNRNDYYMFDDFFIQIKS